MAVRLKTVTIAVTCRHCSKEYDLEVAPKPDKMGDYNIECPECKKL
jgi:DNA-directed RNA polymerase subunit RPC12/RpoP